MSEKTEPRVGFRPGAIEITDNRVFGCGAAALSRRFARRVLAFPEIRSLALDPAAARSTLHHSAASDPGALLARLADAVAAPGFAADEVDLPPWRDGDPVTFHRHGAFVSVFARLDIGEGSLTIGDPALARDPWMAQRAVAALGSVPGVADATATARLSVRFDPHAVSPERLVRVAEATVCVGAGTAAVSGSAPTDLVFANVSVGAAAVSDLVLAPAMPVAAGLLVYSCLGAFKGAALQLRRGEIGLPVLYSGIAAVTLASGQFLPAALMLWFLGYWQRRYCQDLEVERRALIEENLTLPEWVRIVSADGLEPKVPILELVAGQRIRVAAGEVVPLDAVVCSGAALVDGGSPSNGAVSPSRKIAGDRVAAGSRLLAGALDLDIVATAAPARRTRVARAIAAAAAPPAGAWAINRNAEEFAARAVAPTLLAAGAGLALGDLATAGTVLRPDYATGIGLSTPLLGLRNLRFAVRRGAVVQAADALDRLAETQWIVVEEHALLHASGSDLAELQTNFFDQARLLPAAAAAGVWLGDERGPALLRACRAQGLVVRRAALQTVDGDGVTVQFGSHLVRLRGRPVVAGIAPPPLFAEIDGVEVGAMRFARNGRPEAAETVSQLRRQGLGVLLLSPGSAGGLADALAVDRYAGNVSPADRLDLLHEFQHRSVRAAYLGDETNAAALAPPAHLSISLAAGDVPGAGREPPSADIALLAPSVAALPALYALARNQAQRKKQSRYAVMAPNLFCVAGAFAFGFTPMAAVFVSNFGTSLAYHGAKRELGGRPWLVPRADAPEPGAPLPAAVGIGFGPGA